MPDPNLPPPAPRRLAPAAPPPEPAGATPAIQRSLALLLWSIGAAGAVLVWRLLAGILHSPVPVSSMAVRLGVGALALLPGAFTLAAMVSAQMLARAVTGRVNPLQGPEPAFLVVNQRCISNTVEQFLIFIPATLALAAGVEGPHMPEVLALGATFALARLAFWAGYLAAPLARAPGMVATVACNAGALLAAAWFWLQA